MPTGPDVSSLPTGLAGGAVGGGSAAPPSEITPRITAECVESSVGGMIKFHFERLSSRRPHSNTVPLKCNHKNYTAEMFTGYLPFNELFIIMVKELTAGNWASFGIPLTSFRKDK